MAAETPPLGDGPLVAAVRAELVALVQLDTANGQLAVQLARGIERRASAGLSRELREVMGHTRFQAARGR